MTTLELSAELARQIDIISDDEDCLRRALKYIKKLAAQKQQADDSLMTKEEFFAKIDHALEQAQRGEGTGFTDKRAMNEWLNSL